jgi:hypothetical protein
MKKRVEASGDIWSDLYHHPQSLSDASLQLRELLDDDEWRDSLLATRRRPVSRKASRTGPAATEP